MAWRKEIKGKKRGKAEYVTVMNDEGMKKSPHAEAIAKWPDGTQWTIAGKTNAEVCQRYVDAESKGSEAGKNTKWEGEDKESNKVRVAVVMRQGVMKNYTIWLYNKHPPAAVFCVPLCEFHGETELKKALDFLVKSS